MGKTVEKTRPNGAEGKDAHTRIQFIDFSKMEIPLAFDGEKIYIKEKGVTIVDATTKQFVEQFDELRFKDKEGKQIIFKKVEAGR